LIDRNFSIVCVDKRPYRKIAQENWGLSKQQMKGMHVHHRIPLSQGGTNDPSNLYVCSPWFHAWVWHDQGHYIENALKGNKAAIKAKRILRETDPEWRKRELEIVRRGGVIISQLRETNPEYAEHHREFSSRGGTTSSTQFHHRCQTDEQFKEKWLEGALKGAVSLHERRKNDLEFNERVIENCRKNGRKAAQRLNSERWICTVTGYVSTSSGLSRYQRKRDIDTCNRMLLQ
jgi:ribosomal protein L37AE/L43A